MEYARKPRVNGGEEDENFRHLDFTVEKWGSGAADTDLAVILETPPLPYDTTSCLTSQCSSISTWKLPEVVALTSLPSGRAKGL